jgi:hypothetical protein
VFEGIGNGLLNLNDDPQEANEEMGHENPSSMSIGSAASNGVSLVASSSIQNSEETEVPEIVLALQTQPINFLHLEILPHDLNAINSQGEVSTESSGSFQGPLEFDPSFAIIRLQVEGLGQSSNSASPIKESMNVGLSLLPESIDVEPGMEAHLLSKEMLDWSAKQKVERIRLWAKHFAPVSELGGIQVPHLWCDFIALVLLDPVRFEWAKCLLGSKAWELIKANADSNMSSIFSLPPRCPVNTKVGCSISSGKDITPSLAKNSLQLLEVQESIAADYMGRISTPDNSISNSVLKSAASTSLMHMKRKRAKAPLVVREVKTQ